MKKIQHTPLNYKLQHSDKAAAVTSYAGLVLVREALVKLGVMAEMKKFCLKKAGWADEIILEALILLLAAGGRSLSDWEYLSGESGFKKLFGEQCPAVDSLERYLRKLAVIIPQGSCEKGQVAYTEVLESLHQVLIQKAYHLAGSPQKLHLDLDASLIEAWKREAQFSYEKTKAYHPFIAYCPELGLVLAYEFRDGNVSPSEGYLRMTQRVVANFPKEVQWVIRADSKGYQNDFMDWLQSQGMKYFITAQESKELQAAYEKQTHWTKVKSKGIDWGEEVALLNFCPTITKQEQLDFRLNKRNYLAIRKPKSDQQELLEDNYVHTIIVTNAHNMTAEEVIEEHRGRCGSVEHAYEQLKGHVGQGKMPSGDFKVNTAFFSLGCLTHNLLRLMQKHLLPESFQKIQIQTLRFRLLRSAAVVVKRGHGILLRFCQNSKLFQIFQQARAKLQALPV